MLLNKGKELGYKLSSLISKRIYFSCYSALNCCSVIFLNTLIEANTSNGEGCIICSNATINHDVNIEGACLIYSKTMIRLNTLIKTQKNCF